MERKVTRLYTGPDGESHFEDIEVPLEDKGNRGRLSEPIKATEIIFRETSLKDTTGYRLKRHFMAHINYLPSLFAAGIL